MLQRKRLSWYLLFVGISIRVAIYSSKVVAHSLWRYAREPVGAIRLQINLNEWPLHRLRGCTLFPTVPNRTESELRMVVTLLDPFETLELPHIY